MKKVYSIYLLIEDSIYNERLKFLIENQYDYNWKHGKMFGFYAWTTKRQYMEEFFETRDSSKFMLIETDLDKDDMMYHVLQEKHGSQKLGLRPYKVLNVKKKTTTTINVISTLNEFVCSTEFGQENMNEFGPWNYDDKNIIYLLNDKLLSALYMLGYPLNPILLRENDDKYLDDIDIEFSSDNGLAKRRFIDELSILLYLYRDIFDFEIE